MRFIVFLLAGCSFFVTANAQTRLPPETRKLPSKCVCADKAPEDTLSFNGIVSDAELTVAANGRDPSDWQATIFRVVRSSDERASGAVKIWHSTDADKCGLTFDYGRQYTVIAIENEGRLETSACLDPRSAEN